MASKKSKEKASSYLSYLWMLLLKDPMDLNDNQLSVLLQAKDELKSHIRRLEGFPHRIEKVQNYRKRKNELSKMSTEELRNKHQETLRHRASILQRKDEEEIEDSFYEAPPIDSDEHIVYELLKERRAIK